MIALVLVAAADSSDSARPVRVQWHPRLRRAVQLPRLVSELVALSEAATEIRSRLYGGRLHWRRARAVRPRRRL
jgi:hypothetical protein